MATTFNSVDPRTGETGPSYEEATTDDAVSYTHLTLPTICSV